MSQPGGDPQRTVLAAVDGSGTVAPADAHQLAVDEYPRVVRRDGALPRQWLTHQRIFHEVQHRVGAFHEPLAGTCRNQPGHRCKRRVVFADSHIPVLQVIVGHVDRPVLVLAPGVDAFDLPVRLQKVEIRD
jgi:hypothetical protein